ncbi:DEAD/DEAH box helicase [Aspergillus brunneoviolaceus CBS 621.78]|uniref:Uncharacterized protein n=1 Tax=Aspergillus brunneoviolaceus CBS 621.78 TaxID=1450534 RepID=A0ACD1GD76_9EURO|nr:hypothetical protein BO95DRAFT_462217 [Aspergillus brunneoviolaceus CBS 621.78]RAH47187.1 hypothetical protein BO95DRAFT_462217 [Aspergillus brunneoviolaceus CBS 621.78]
MAPHNNDEAIREVLEDLELQHVILQSLEEECPDAEQDRQEILDVIEGLETRLAVLRGEPIGRTANSSPSPTRSSSMSRTYFDGVPAFPLDNPTSSSHSAERAARSFPGSPLNRTSRKRQLSTSSIEGEHDDGDDDSDDLEAPIRREQRKRVRRRLSPESHSSRRSAEDESDVGLDDGNDELRRMLGLDSFRLMQEENRRAEHWLKAQKEQERRDAEFARQLAQDDSITPHSALARSPPPPTVPRPPFTAPAHSRPAPHATPACYIPGSFLEGPQPPKRLPPTAPQYDGYRESKVVTLPDDSDDSDIAEIDGQDFRPNLLRPPLSPRKGRQVSNDRFDTHSAAWRNGKMGPNGPNDLRSAYSPYLNGLAAGPSALGPPSSRFGPRVLPSTMARLNSGSSMLNDMSSTVSQASRVIFGGSDISFMGPGGYESALDYMNDLYGYGEDPKQTKEEIMKLLESIRPDSEISKENREGTPEALKFTLLEHQKLGLAWMKSMEEGENKGGILADDMGLGKTIQAIALMVSRPSTNPERKSTLVIAPVALIHQWKREIQRILKPGKHQLSIHVLHGDKRTTTFKDLKKYDVVLTTFGTLAAEFKKLEKAEEIKKHDSDLGMGLMKNLPCLSPLSKWYRVIIDEAQCIKNRKTKSAMACCTLHSTYRWCMTGTPMMNSVDELQSLLKFLRIAPYSNHEKFQRTFTNPLKGSPAGREKTMQALQVLLKAVLLRRTKTSKIDGKPILQLPPKVSERVHAVFSEEEDEFYKALETRTQLQVNRYIEEGTMGRNYSSILVLLLRLRQACCHPHLIKDFSIETPVTSDDLDLVANAKALSDEVVTRLKNNDDLECPICIDAVENPVIFFPCGHGTCAECFSRISDPAVAVRNGVDGANEIKCPNCRGKVDPKKITDHISFKKVHCPDSTEGDEEVLEPTDGAASEDDSDDDSDDDSLSRFIADDDGDYGGSRTRKSKGKKPQKTKKTLAQLRKDAQKNQKAKRKYLRRLEKTWIPSAKIEKTMEILRGISSNDSSEKTIIFSQFTSLLDLLEIPIAREGWDYRRYDGSMKPAERNASVIEFTDNPDCKVMLVSLKAGNSGLNLVAASQVIIFDPFWNPYVEEQAVDRAHRIGQARPVQIHRIVVKGTVEDRILELQDQKRELVEGALDEKASKNVSRLDTRQLRHLFNIH